MSLSFDSFVKISGEKFRFRESKSDNDKLIDRIKLELDVLEINQNQQSYIINYLIKVKGINYLNLKLLIIVYLYFAEKDFDPTNVIQNTNVDFKNQLKKINDEGYFIIQNDREIHRFRQDFFVYLLLLNNVDTEIEENETKIEVDGIEDDIDYDGDVYESLKDEDYGY